MFEKIAVVARVNAFSLSLSASIIPRTRSFDSLIDQYTISDRVVQKAGNQRGSLRTSPTMSVSRVSAATPQRPCVSRKRAISRRLVAGACDDHEISAHDLVNANPAILHARPGPFHAARFTVDAGLFRAARR